MGRSTLRLQAEKMILSILRKRLMPVLILLSPSFSTTTTFISNGLRTAELLELRPPSFLDSCQFLDTKDSKRPLISVRPTSHNFCQMLLSLLREMTKKFVILVLNSV